VAKVLEDNKVKFQEQFLKQFFPEKFQSKLADQFATAMLGGPQSLKPTIEAAITHAVSTIKEPNDIERVAQSLQCWADKNFLPLKIALEQVAYRDTAGKLREAYESRTATDDAAARVQAVKLELVKALGDTLIQKFLIEEVAKEIKSSTAAAPAAAEPPVPPSSDSFES
jgi:hypothetical protein